MQFDPGNPFHRLVQDFQLADGKLVIRNFADRSEVLSLNESYIFNCTGLGAAPLCGDDTLPPIKGQLVGGVYRIGDGSQNVEPEETERIVTEHQRLFAGFG